jgi:hypothetical protein
MTAAEPAASPPCAAVPARRAALVIRIEAYLAARPLDDSRRSDRNFKFTALVRFDLADGLS